MLLNLHADLQAVIYVNVARTLSEAEEAKKEFLSVPTDKKAKAAQEE